MGGDGLGAAFAFEQRLGLGGSRIRNKLLHADFPELYKKTKVAYDLPHIKFHQSSFQPLVVEIQTTLTLTRNGLHLNMQNGTARDSLGQAVPAKRLLPGEGGSIPIDFEYFYRSGHFVHVYDVLRTTYESIVFLRYES